MPKAREARAVVRVGVHEHVADQFARHEQAGGANQRETRHPLGTAHRELGGEPAAGAMADQREAVELESVEHLAQ